MNRPDMHRYAQDLKEQILGRRRRKLVAREFLVLLGPFLEEHPTPSYEDLVEAFGPPDQLADTLVQSMPDLPKALKRRQKWVRGIVAAVVIAVVGAVGFLWANQTETDSLLAQGVLYSETVTPNLELIQDRSFPYGSLTWRVPFSCKAYMVELTNTNDVPTNGVIQYSKYRPVHVFMVRPGETATFVVNDPGPMNHKLTLSSSNGTLSGTVRVWTSKESLGSSTSTDKTPSSTTSQKDDDETPMETTVSETMPPNSYDVLDTPLSNAGFHWTQPDGYGSYLLWLDNTTDQTMTVTVRYKKGLTSSDSYTFTVPPNSNGSHVVNNALSTEHDISFTTSTGAVTGTLRVSVSDTAL